MSGDAIPDASATNCTIEEEHQSIGSLTELGDMETPIDVDNEPEVGQPHDEPEISPNQDPSVAEMSEGDSMIESPDTKEKGPGQHARAKSNPKKLFVGNINYKTRNKKLWDFFENFGSVQYCEILKDLRNKSKGRGFVTFRTQEGADAALKSPEDDLLIDNRYLKLSPAEGQARVKNRSKVKVSSERVEDFGYRPMECDDGSTAAEVLPTSGNECPSPINYLNDDILLHIFSLFSLKESLITTRVCKRWYRLVHASHQTKERLVIPQCSWMRGFGDTSGPKVLKDVHLSMLLSHGWPAMKVLDLSQSIRTLSDKSLRAVFKYLPQLEELNISGATFPLLDVFKSMKAMEQLRVLRLDKCQFLNEDALWTVLNRHRNLKLRHLSMDDNSKVNGKCFHVMNDKIQVLSLKRMAKLSEYGMQKVKLRGSELKELYLDNCRALNDACLEILGTLTTLEKLQLSGSILQLSADEFRHLANLVNLTHLDLHGNNFAINDELLGHILQQCQRISYLDVSCCHLLTNQVIFVLPSLKELTFLDISYIKGLDDEGLKQVAMCANLDRVLAKGLAKVSAEGVARIGELCSHLSELDISMCAFVTSECMNSFIINAQGRDRLDKISLVTGGTLVETELCDLPENLIVVDFDRSNHNLITDPELTATFGVYEDYDYDDFDDLDDDLQDYLTCDDPLYAERYEMS